MSWATFRRSARSQSQLFLEVFENQEEPLGQIRFEKNPHPATCLPAQGAKIDKRARLEVCLPPLRGTPRRNAIG